MKPTGKRLFGAAAMALWLAIGGGVVWGVACAILASVGQSFLRDDDPWFRTIVVRSDGAPLIETHSRRNYENVSWTTLDGAPVASSSVHLGNIPQASGAGMLPPRVIRDDFPRLPWMWRIVGASDMRSPSVYWYFIHDGHPDGRGYFEGYDSESRQRVGYLGLAGLRDDRPPPDDQFPVPGGALRAGALFETASYAGRFYASVSAEDVDPKRTPLWVRHFISGGKVLRFDPRKRTITPLVDAKDAVSLGVVQETRPLGLTPQARPPATRLVVRTPDRLLLVDRDTAKLDSFMLPDPLKDAQFRVYLLGRPDHVDESELLFITERRFDGNHDVDVYWADPDGAVRRHQSCRLATGGWTDTPQAGATAASLIAPAPLVATGFSLFGVAQTKLVSGAATTWTEAIGQIAPQVWPPLAVLTLVSAALAWLCYRRQVRYALPGTAWWIVFVFLGGLPAYLGYRFHRPWAPLRACPHCRRDVPRDRETCAACGHEFPAPATLGTEVFAAQPGLFSAP